MAYDLTNWNEYHTQQTLGATSSVITGTLSGIGALSGLTGVGLGVAGPIGLGIGLLLGAISIFQNQSELRSQRDVYRNQLGQLRTQRNSLITNAQKYISDQRSYFDSTYGEGMYDTYDELFRKILGMPSGSQTVSDLLESLSLDDENGVIKSSTAGLVTEDMLTGSISLSDINSTYLEYMQNQIMDSESVLGLQFRQRTAEENQILSAYRSSIEQYNLETAQKFSDAFLSHRSELLSSAAAMGEALSAQSGSGIRQTGSGRNLTNIQKFQQDLSDAAYASTIGYLMDSYKLGIGQAEENLIYNVQRIRNENAIAVEQFTNEMISSMNRYYGELGQAASEINSAEETIGAVNEEIDRINDSLWW